MNIKETRYKVNNFSSSIKVGLLIIFLSNISCSSYKYISNHSDKQKFNSDLEDCIRDICYKNKKDSNLKYKLSYGGGGGGGGGGGAGSMTFERRISMKTLEACLKLKGYSRSDKGYFIAERLYCR